jgi:hypothetical protein
MTRLLLGLVLALGACAHSMPNEPPPSGRRGKGGNESGRVKLAILPVESDAFPRLAAGLNTMLHDVQLKGVDDYFLSKVTLEVALLSIECIEKNNDCYTQVGKSMDAQRVLLAVITPNGPAKRKRRPVKVSVVLFNVDEGQPQHSGSKDYESEDAASAGLSALMQDAIGEFTVSTKTAGAK